MAQVSFLGVFSAAGKSGEFFAGLEVPHDQPSVLGPGEDHLAVGAEREAGQALFVAFVITKSSDGTEKEKLGSIQNCADEKGLYLAYNQANTSLNKKHECRKKSTLMSSTRTFVS